MGKLFDPPSSVYTPVWLCSEGWILFIAMLRFVVLQNHKGKLAMNIHTPLLETLQQDSHISQLDVSDSADKAFTQHHISSIKLIVLLYVSVFSIAKSPEALCVGDWEDPLEAAAFVIDLLS